MKTPEQIAAEIQPEFPGHGINNHRNIRSMIATGIKRDRAQREHPMSAPLIELREWASTVSRLMAEDKSNDWSEELAQLEVIEEGFGA